MLFAFCLPALASVAGPVSGSSVLPHRPAVVVTHYKEAWLPVVGAEGYSPVVISEGKPAALSVNTGMMLTLGERYAPGFVTIANTDLADVPSTDAATEASMPNELKSTAVNFTADLTSDVDIADAYAIMIVYPPDRPADAPPVLAIYAKDIGPLQSGATTHVSVRLPKLGQIESPDWKILIFAAGR